MFNMTVSSNNTSDRAARLFITMLTILLVGKTISLVPVMQKLELLNTFKAAEVIWLFAKFAALSVFYFFAHTSIDAIPNRRGVRSFLRGIAEPLTALVIVILVQELVWQLLAPFASALGRSMYYGIAILLIVGVSVWFVLRAYRHANDLIDTVSKVRGLVSRFIAHNNVVCSHCQAEISSKAHFCDRCGHKIQESLRCSECGVTVVDSQNYCQNCGATLGKTE